MWSQSAYQPHTPRKPVDCAAVEDVAARDDQRGQAGPQRSAAAALLLGLFAFAAGCHDPVGPDLLLIPAGRYAAAFDAATEAARMNDLPAALRDPRAGIIETEPRLAPSLLEPWRSDGASFRHRLEHTVAHMRRRARFEFTPVAAPSPGNGEAAHVLPGPDVVAMRRADVDRTQHDGDLVLRVRVYLEQVHRRGVRRSSWTQSATTVTRIIPHGSPGQPLPTATWTPVERDVAFERRLLGIVAARMELPAVDRPLP